MPNVISSNRLSAIVGATDLATMRVQLQALVQETANVARFAWAFPALGSTDEHVAAYLTAHPVDARLDPCHYPQHLSEASSLLDRCLARRDQIYSLETTATTTALDYLLAEAVHDGELGLAKVALKAARKQGSADGGDADEDTLLAQFQARAGVRQSRLVLHGQDGSPLNYKQRIDELRDLLADDVRSLYELLMRARIGIHNAGPALDRPPVPGWDPARRDNFKRLVEWCRETIRQLEFGSLNEIVYKRAFFLIGDKLVPSTTKFLRNDLASYKFKLEQKHFTRSGPHRILNIGVAVAGDVWMSATASLPIDPAARVAEEQRREIASADVRRAAANYAFGTAIAVPPQVARFAGGEVVQWSRPPFVAEGEVEPWQNLSDQRFPAGSTSAVMNTNPLGDWELWLTPQYRRADGSIRPLSDPNKGNPWWELTDVVLFMTIASARV